MKLSNEMRQLEVGRELWRENQNNVFMMSVMNPSGNARQLNTEVWRSKRSQTWRNQFGDH